MNSSVLWKPSAHHVSQARMTEFQRWSEKMLGTTFTNYGELHRWSVENPTVFWRLAWDFCGLVGEPGHTVLFPASDPIDVEFFPHARMNVVETFLKNPDSREAIVFHAEDGRSERWSRSDLCREVEILAAGLKDAGIEAGDHIAGFVANMPQTVAAMLAAASLGAVWSSCSPDSGADVAADRFSQIRPKLIFAVDGYYYGGKIFETRETIVEIINRVPSIQQAIMIPYARNCEGLSTAMISYKAFKPKEARALLCQPLGFRDPIYVMFSSGSTGKPKCIEHSGGGTLLKLMVEHQLHCDLREHDRLFFHTTCSWMMWNWQIAALASGATIILYDGNPTYPNFNRLFDLVEHERVTHFGISAKFIDIALKRGIKPFDNHFFFLRTVLSTGSPLSPEAFEYVYENWKEDLHLASICGGTDILGCFIGGCPTLPVNAGEIQVPILGLDVAILGPNGSSVKGDAGELVCRNAHPSMPTRFIQDAGRELYRSSYFNTYPKIWRQGDLVMQTETGGYVVLGRSDSTLNPGGVRIGTAEIYRQVEKIEQIVDSVVVGQSIDNDVRIVLFVVTQENNPLSDDLRAEIQTKIRQNASPRHVPEKVIQVAEIPRTKSGKVAELAVRDAVNGHPIRDVTGLANPSVLTQFINQPELKI